jgi:hypothetical protein
MAHRLNSSSTEFKRVTFNSSQDAVMNALNHRKVDQALITPNRRSVFCGL